MATDKNSAGLSHLVGPAPQDVCENILRQFLHGKTDDIQRAPRFPSHGVDIRKGVGCGYLPEQIRVVDDGCEEIKGLDDGFAARHPDNRCVLIVTRTYNHPLPFPRVAGKRRKNTLQVPRSNLCRSTGGARTRCEAVNGHAILHLQQQHGHLPEAPS